MAANFIELDIVYVPEEDGVDYEGLGIERPEDYEYDVEPTIIRIDMIEAVNPADDPEFSIIHMEGRNYHLRAANSYEEVKLLLT